MRLERLLAIVMLLLEKENVKGSYLAEIFEVSTRTIYRDIEAINQAGIPIITKTGMNGGLSIMPEFKIAKHIFTTKDIVTILTGLNFTAEALSGDEVNVALAKVSSFIPEEKEKEISFKTNQLIFDFSSWIGGEALKAKVDTIKRALGGNQRICFSYLSKSGNQTRRTVEPCHLINKENIWYLQAYCLASSDFRIFKLSRLFNLELLEETYQSRKAPDFIADFSGEMAKKTEKIKLLVDESILERVLDLCGEEHIEKLKQGKYLAEFNFVPDDYGYSILLGFGAKCKCIAPMDIQQELLSRLKATVSMYES